MKQLKTIHRDHAILGSRLDMQTKYIPLFNTPSRWSYKYVISGHIICYIKTISRVSKPLMFSCLPFSWYHCHPKVLHLVCKCHEYHCKPSVSACFQHPSLPRQLVNQSTRTRHPKWAIHTSLITFKWAIYTVSLISKWILIVNSVSGVAQKSKYSITFFFVSRDSPGSWQQPFFTFKLTCPIREKFHQKF